MITDEDLEIMIEKLNKMTKEDIEDILKEIGSKKVMDISEMIDIDTYIYDDLRMCYNLEKIACPYNEYPAVAVEGEDIAA